MKKYLVTYDLNKAWQNYINLWNAIESYSYIKVMKSLYFINTYKNSFEIYEHLKNYIDWNDSLFISEININRQWFIDKERWKFLNQI